MRIYVQKIHTILQNLENSVRVLLKKGLCFSLFLCLVAIFLLMGYISGLTPPLFFHAGFSLLKSGLLFASLFVIFAIFFDGIVKQKI